MDDADRQKIMLNIDKLIQYTDYNELMEKCIQKELLFLEMKDQIEVSSCVPLAHLYETPKAVVAQKNLSFLDFRCFPINEHGTENCWRKSRTADQWHSRNSSSSWKSVFPMPTAF